VTMNTLRRLISLIDSRGSTAVETAMLIPVYSGLTLAVMTGGFLLFAAASLHFAVEGAARCSSVMTTQCTSASTTQTYATNHYYGPSIPVPTFTASTAACGHQVSGSVTYVLNAGVTSWNVPISATACFP
jgi:Flp pilus assembly protein TadG